MLVGLGALMVFMLITYGRFGVYTNAALFLNLMMILGVDGAARPARGADLPGIAGLVLTVGAAVDANVLINERIREERAKGAAWSRRSSRATRNRAARSSTPTSPT